MKVNINPTILLFNSIVLSFVILLTQSWKINLFIIIITLVTLSLLRQQSWKKIIFSLFSLTTLSFIYFLTAYLNSNDALSLKYQLNSPLLNGIHLGTRVFALGLLGTMLYLCTTKKLFIASLISNLNVSVSIAYSILVAINFLTLIKEEYNQAKLALKIRGEASLFIPFHALMTMLMRLIRQSEYTALAMEVKNFSANRTQYLQPKILLIDKLFVIINGLLIIIALLMA